MHKKAQGLSVNTIIIAAIALIVLVVLIAVFTGRFGIFSKSLNECPGNRCMSESLCKPPNVIMRQYSCGDGISNTGAGGIKVSFGGDVCCMKLEK